MRLLRACLLLAVIAVFPIRAQPILVPGQSWTPLGQGYQLTASESASGSADQLPLLFPRCGVGLLDESGPAFAEKNRLTCRFA